VGLVRRMSESARTMAGAATRLHIPIMTDRRLIMGNSRRGQFRVEADGIKGRMRESL
jgi:hypothetical protein